MTSPELDEDLSWAPHIEKIKTKLATGNYAIARVKHFIPLEARLNLYNSLFKSHIEYGLIAWGCGPVSSLNKITNLQKSAIRHVSKSLFNSHSDPLLKKLKILKFYDLTRMLRAGFIQQYILGKLPPAFENTFTKISNFSRTREFYLPLVSQIKLKNSPTYSLLHTWNKQISLPDKNITFDKIDPKSNSKEKINHLSRLYTSLRQQTLASYSSKVKCKNLYCIDCKRN